ncbi:hypothetical protein [Luteimonas aquatica]|uniref:hypothetical protein n=1 Tax=Luteimonas aquatica TaxID=450364 RepID=UPI001F58C5AD|nr:hypothetical protein [Luteimonas aquatica]
MNAISDDAPLALRTPMPMPIPRSRQFLLLLRREFWEHKGGFLWVPLVAGGVSLLLTLLATIFGEAVLRGSSDKIIDIGDRSMRLNDAIYNLDSLNLSAVELRKLGDAIEAILYLSTAWSFIAMTVVVFLYCLNSLYDERKDRSVLFWKSLPISDGQTVLSKAVSAALVIPTLAALAGIATMLGFLLLMSALVLFHGGNPFTFVWATGNPFSVIAHILAAIPIYALWALPTVGWLMLCSAWARGKPGLWAIMLPLFAGIAVTFVSAIFGSLDVLHIDSGWFWNNIVRRALTSIVPGSWIDTVRSLDFADSNRVMASVSSLRSLYATLLTPQLWLGAIAGALMIYGAVQLRRRRELAD